MPNRVLDVRGPEAFPDAAMRLTNEPDLDLLLVKDFFSDDRLPRVRQLADIPLGVEKRSASSPVAYEYGQAAVEAFEEAAERAGEWLNNQGYILEPVGRFLPSRVTDRLTPPHMDEQVLEGHMVGPIVASIGLKGLRLVVARRGESVMDETGRYDPDRFQDFLNRTEPNLNYKYWFTHRREFSQVVQRPTDLVAWMGTPEPEPHGVPWATPGQSAAIYELGYTIPDTYVPPAKPLVRESLARMAPAILQGA